MENRNEIPQTLEILQNELERILLAEELKRKKLYDAHLRYEKEIAPVLDQLRDYLAELIQLLNNKLLQQSERTKYLCMPEVEYDLSQIGVGAFGVIRGQQRDYEIITSTEAFRLSDFCLHYQCAPERIVGTQHIELRDAKDSKRRIYLQNILKKYNLQYSCTERTCQDNSVKMIFTVQPMVKVHIEFSGNLEGDSFRVVINNAGGMISQGQFGKICFPRVTPNQVSVESIEHLIRFIIRQPHKLFWYWDMEETTAQVLEPKPVSKPTPPKQTYNFDAFSIRNVLSKLQKQTDRLNTEVKKSNSEQVKKMAEVKESVEEHSQRIHKQHNDFMGELEKIRAVIEKGQAENRSFFSWIVSSLSLRRKVKER